MTEIPENSAPFWLDSKFPTLFPPPALALKEPDGLLAIGGDLSPERLLAAYRQGIFPWYSKQQPILWWSPDPRMVLFPEHLHVSKSLRKTIRKNIFKITINRDFASVISACSKPRNYTNETWITDDMNQAYQQLHNLGYAHSVECWHEDMLVGGLYGVSIGNVFFGESMFSTMTDASKVAFVYLVKQLQQWEFKLIDCQVYSEHLASLGASDLPRKQFLSLLEQYCSNNDNITWPSANDEYILNYVITP